MTTRILGKVKPHAIGDKGPFWRPIIRNLNCRNDLRSGHRRLDESGHCQDGKDRNNDENSPEYGFPSCHERSAGPRSSRRGEGRTALLLRIRRRHRGRPGGEGLPWFCFPAEVLQIVTQVRCARIALLWILLESSMH